LLKHGEASVAPGREDDAQADRDRGVKNLIRKAKELDFQLLPPQNRPAPEAAA
jgi:hypothetical protein